MMVLVCYDVETVKEGGKKRLARIAKTCKKENFAVHGHYVKCVTQTSTEAVKLDLITNKEKARFVSQAAKDK